MLMAFSTRTLITNTNVRAEEVRSKKEIGTLPTIYNIHERYTHVIDVSVAQLGKSSVCVRGCVCVWVSMFVFQLNSVSDYVYFCVPVWVLDRKR